MYVSFNRMWYNKKQAVKKTGRGSYRKWKGKKMKKKLIAVIAGVFLMGSLTGCSSQLSNEYITIKQYKGLEVPQVEATELTDDQVTNYVNYFLQADATRTEVTDREAQTGDTVNIDYVGKVDGVEFQGGSAQGTDLELGSGSFIGANGDYQGFEDQIVGHNKGEQFDITVQFPDTYMNTEMAGKVAVFTITLNGIYTVDVPKLTDKWVKENSVEATTVKEYKKEIKEKIENQQMYQNLLNALVDQIEVKKDLPKDKVKEQKEAIINQYESTAEYYQMELGDYLTQYMGMTEDQFKEKAQTVAENTVRNQMAVELLCEKKNLEPTDKEYEIGLKQYAALAGYRTDQIAEYEEKNGKENIEQSIMQEKAAKYLQKSCVQVEQEDETTNENAKDTQNSTTENKDQNTDQSSDESSDQSSTDNAQE